MEQPGLPHETQAVPGDPQLFCSSVLQLQSILGAEQQSAGPMPTQSPLAPLG